MLKITRIHSDDKDIGNIRKLYDSSFPDNERVPFLNLLIPESEERQMYGVYEKEELIGMYFLYLKDELIYLSYICVSEEKRNLGYGTQILKRICDSANGKRIVIDIEECRPEDENYTQEVNRRNFYLRNGFQSTGIFYHIYGVDYELLSYGGTVNREEWHSLIRYHWGKRADTAIYR